MTLDAAVQLWLESALPHRKDQTVGDKSRHWAGMIDGKPLADAPAIAAAAVAKWRQAGDKGKPLRPATINSRLNVLKAALKYAFLRGWSDANLSGRIQLLRTENKREVYLTPKEVKALALAADGITGAAIMLSAYTGLRVSELLALKAGDVTADEIRIRKSKTGKPRVVPVPAVARQYLSAVPLGIAYRTLLDRFWAARQRAGLEHVRWHDLRHTTASLLINAGVDLYTVGRILGHTATVTTARYAHLSHQTLKRAMGKLR